MTFRQLLPAAIIEHDTETFLSLLAAGIDINCPIKTSEGGTELTPLCMAAEHGFLEGIRFLVEREANVTQCTKASIPNYHSTSLTPGYAIFVHLKRRRNALNIETCSSTPSQNKAIMDALTSSDSYVHGRASVGGKVKGQEGLTPMIAACRHGHLEVVEYLCELLTDQGCLAEQLLHQDLEGHDAFAAACVGGHLDIVQLLKPLYPPATSANHPNIHCQNSLIMAAISGNVDLVSYLINEGASWKWADDRNYNVMVYSVFFQQLTVVEKLLTLCPRTLYSCHGSLCLELALGQTDMFKLLVEKGAISPNEYADSNGNTILHRAVIHPQTSPELVDYILSTDSVNVNKIDYLGQTALGILLQQKSFSHSLTLELATLLLNAGCDPNIPKPPRIPPLFSAVDIHSPALVQLLIRAGADVSIKDLCNGTPLCALVNNISKMTCSEQAQVKVREIMEILINADVSLVQPSQDHVAFWGLNLKGELVEYLLLKLEQRGCQLPLLTSAQGLSLLQSAILRYNFHAIKYCLQRGYAVDTLINIAPSSDPVFILNAYIGWNDRLVKCTPEIDEFNIKGRPSKCRRYTMARLLTVMGVPWSVLATIVTPSLRNSCLHALPISLMQMCRNTLRNHLKTAYYRSVTDSDLAIPEIIRKYLLFDDVT